MEGSKYNCRGDGCKCQVGAVGAYCDPKCKASSDIATCQCEHPVCTDAPSDEVKLAAR
jgi:hypothetical protein